MPIVANTKNIDPKKNRKPCVCAFDVEPAGLNNFRVFNVKPPVEVGFAIALLIATSSFIAP